MGRPRLRRSVPRGLPGNGCSRRGDSGHRGAAPGASPRPRNLARLRRPRREHRFVEARLSVHPVGRGARSADPDLPSRSRSGASRLRGDGGPRPERGDGRGASDPRGHRRQRGRGLGGADREPRRVRGHHPSRQRNHDRDEPPAREYGGQPLQGSQRRRHHRPDSDRFGDRDDGHPSCGPGRARDHRIRDRRDARRGREARSRLSRGSGASGLGRSAPTVRDRGGRRHASRSPAARRRPSG